MSSATRDGFTFLFPIWMCLISFSCLTAVARTSNVRLHYSSESRYPYLVTNLRGQALSL